MKWPTIFSKRKKENHVPRAAPSKVIFSVSVSRLLIVAKGRHKRSIKILVPYVQVRYIRGTDERRRKRRAQIINSGRFQIGWWKVWQPHLPFFLRIRLFSHLMNLFSSKCKTRR